MNENVSLETLTDNNTGEIITGEDITSNYTNQMEENSTSRETEATELNTEERVSGYTVERNEVARENDMGDSHFESRVASLSLNSDSTEESYVTTDGEKVQEDNSPASAPSYETGTVAAAENFEGEQNGIPATEENPFLQSVKYLEKHQILRLFQVRFCAANISSSITPMKWQHLYNRLSLEILF